MKTKVYVKKGKRGKWILRWFDADGKEKQQTTDYPAIPSKRKLAEREAALKEQDLEKDSLPPQNWDDFKTQYLEAVEVQKSGSQTMVNVVLKGFNKACRPMTVQEVDNFMLSKYVAQLRKDGLAPSTIKGYLKRLKAALNWAFDMGFIAKKVRYKEPKVKKSNIIRTRELKKEDLEKLLEAAKTVRPTDYKTWQFYIKGLFYSGLRRSESIQLGWDWSFEFSIDIDGSIPRFVIMGEGQKSGQDQFLTMVPEFVELLQEVPKHQRRGRVFKLPRRGDFPDKNQITRVVTKISRVAGVVVDSNGSFASPQIFRRSFGTRWARQIMPAELQQLMRHEDIKTTMEYYVNVGTEDLWKKLNQKEGVKQ